MTFSPLKRILGLFLLALLCAPSSLFFAPKPAHAQLATFDVGNAVIHLGNFIEDTASTAFEAISSASTYAEQVKEYVLDPIAWALSQTMLQSLTGSVVNFVNGHGNGTGQSQFVLSIASNLQKVGEVQTNAFLGQLGTQLNQSGSPFANAITANLRNSYAQGSSLSGYFSTTQCTLNQASPNIKGFLGGDFSQGGWGAWFALTQSQNNPYQLSASAQGQLGSLITNAQTNRQSELSWNQGFMSWCGGTSSNSGTLPACKLPDGTWGVQTAGGTCVSNDSPVGSDPGDPCTNSDGTPGTIQTPGSIIKSQLDTSLGSGVNKLVSADEIDETIGSLATSFFLNIVTGSGGGLGGTSQDSVLQYTNGATSPNDVQKTIAFAQGEITLVNSYEAAINTIVGDANTASSSVHTLITKLQSASATATPPTYISPSCPTSLADANAALTGEIQPALDSMQSKYQTAEKTRALALQVISEASSTASGAQGALLADSEALGTRTPSQIDLTNIQADAKINTVTSAAGTVSLVSATPSGSLAVSGGSTADRMALITQNATAATNSCVVTAFGTP